MSKIKILYTIPNFDTAGSGKVVYDLVKNLDPNKFAPEICVFHTKGKFFKEVEQLGVPIHVFKFEADYKPFITLPVRIWKISKFFRELDVDLIHSWHWSSDFTEAAAAKMAGIPYIYTKKAMGWGNRSWRWRSQLSSKVIAINDDMMTEFFNGTKINAVQLPLGVDVDYYDPEKVDVKNADDMISRAGVYNIISVVNMVPVKGIQYLLDAVVQLDDPEIRVHLVGNDATDYAQELKEKYANDNIRFLGKKLDVRPYLKKADLFVIPTLNQGRKEGMPVAPLEAMSMGLPVIGSRIAGVKDVLKAYPGRLFEPADSNDLARKINEIKAQTREHDHGYDKNLRQYVVDNFSLRNFILDREKLYQDIVRNG